MHVRRLAVRMSLAAAILALGACASSGRDDAGRHSRIQGNITPELLTLDQREIESDDRTFITWNQNWRMFWGDLNRAMLNDRPSSLRNFPQSYPIGH